MFLNQIRLLIALILSASNFLLFLFPGLMIAEFVVQFIEKRSLLLEYGGWVVFIAMMLMLLYLLRDMLFGTTVKGFTQTSHKIEAGGELDWIYQLFDPVRRQFGLQVSLYLEQGEEINAFAVRTLFHKAVVISEGLLRHLQDNIEEAGQASALQAIIAHELSHLKHWDFLPGLIIYANEQATGKLEAILHIGVELVTRMVLMIPFFGAFIGIGLAVLYRISRLATGFFASMVVRPLFTLSENAIGRSIEYRCDRDAAKTIGSEATAKALSVLGSESYTSIFSTHPPALLRATRAYGAKYEGDSCIGGGFIPVVFGTFWLVFLGFLTFASWVYISDLTTFQSVSNAVLLQLVPVWQFSIKPIMVQAMPLLNFASSLWDFILIIHEQLGVWAKNGVLWALDYSWQLNIRVFHEWQHYLRIFLWSVLWMLLIHVIWYIIDGAILQIKILMIRPKINRVQSTPIDWALFQAIEHKNPKAAYEAIKAGANLCTTLSDGRDLVTFAQESKCRKMVRFYKRVGLKPKI